MAEDPTPDAVHSEPAGTVERRRRLRFPVATGLLLAAGSMLAVAGWLVASQAEDDLAAAQADRSAAEDRRVDAGDEATEAIRDGELSLDSARESLDALSDAADAATAHAFTTGAQIDTIVQLHDAILADDVGAINDAVEESNRLGNDANEALVSYLDAFSSVALP